MNASRLRRLASALLFGSLSGCSLESLPAPVAPVAPASNDGSMLCEGLADRFIGLPSLSAAQREAAATSAPLSGRFWVRSCSAAQTGDEVRLRLQGPGWYFVDERDDDVWLRQQIPFDLTLELDARLKGTVETSVISVWLEPSAEPRVDVRVAGALDVRPRSSWGTMLNALPFVSLSDRAAQRFSNAATAALRGKLREGATITYDLGARQADATLGKLAAGQVPQRAFHDGIGWLANERLLLDAAAVHVLGPFTPGPTRLDVLVERGAGVTYSVLCAEDMPANYPALVAGDAASTARHARSRSVEGLGAHTTDFRVDDCRFYLLVSALRSAPTLASLRVRS